MQTTLIARATLALISLAFVPCLPAATPADTPRTVTLITGDQVTTVAPRHGVSIQPGRGREQMEFATRYQTTQGSRAEQLYVIPKDAAPLIASGKVDRELFNITALTESKFDDANRDDLPIILTYQRQAFAARRMSASELSVVGATVAAQLNSVNGTAVRTAKKQSQQFWNSVVSGGNRVEKIWLDRMLQPTLDRSVPEIGAPTAWAAGYTGQGVIVGIIDSGVDLTHPDLAGRVIATHNFTPEVDEDIVGHGTHVSSIIAGSGAASNGRYKGVAPDAQLVVGKVCEVGGCLSSNMILGMQWAVIEQHAKIVNISLGTNDTPGVDPVEAAVNELSADYGALFVVAAGNYRSRPVSSPATADAALAVGAIDRNEQIASFSSRGPRVGDNAIKPEITAPGVEIVAAWAANTSPPGTPVGDRYIALSGTSMATPHVVGAAAILSQRFPNYDGAQLKAVLMGTALPHPTASAFAQGAGRVDVAAAINVQVVASPVALNLGTAQWPHQDDAPVVRTVTYRSVSSAATTVSFSFEMSDPKGNALPRGMFTVTPQTLTIPAGGTATATVTVDTRIEGPDGFYSGRLVAIDSTNTARPMVSSVPIAIQREPEAYDLTLSHIDRQGLNPTFYDTQVVPVDDPNLPLTWLSTGAGEVTIRIPPGRYCINAWILTSADGSSSFLVQPALDLRAGTRVVLDARTAQLAQLTGPSPSAKQVFTEIAWIDPSTFGGAFGSGISVNGPATFYTAQVGDPAAGLLFYAAGQWRATRTDANGGAHPEFYSATWPQHDVFPTGLNKVVKPETMAVVHAKYAAARPNIVTGAVTILPGVSTFFNNAGAAFFVDLPYEETEYYSLGPDAGYENVLTLFDDNSSAGGFGSLYSGPTRYSAARHSVSRFAEAPYAQPTDDSWRRVWRWFDDYLEVLVPMIGDSAGHSGSFTIGDNHMALYKDGVLLGEIFDYYGLFLMPPEPGTYRLEASLTQSSLELSSRLNYAWTFSSENIGDELDYKQIAVLSAQFKPTLNARGEAPLGSVQRMPITLAQDGATGPVKVKSLTVDVSFDEGGTWHSVPVKREGKEWCAIVRHPLQGQYVSLRTQIDDGSGNQFEETIIRAYSLAR
jgi:subtilisin family serine protease